MCKCLWAIMVGTVSAQRGGNRQETSNHWARKVSYGGKKRNRHACNRRRETCTIWHCEKNTAKHLLPQSGSFSLFFLFYFFFYFLFLSSFIKYISISKNILCVCVYPARFYSSCQIPILYCRYPEGVPSTPA